MSLLLLSRPRVVAAPQGIAAQLFNGDGATGTLRYTGGFPLRPGDVPDGYDMQDITVLVDGAEVACHLEPLFGHHTDVTVRSLRYDFDAPHTATTAELRIGQRRTLPSITRRPIGEAEHDARHWMVATSAEYLTATDLTGQPLVASSQWTSGESAWLEDAFVGMSGVPARGTATYEYGRAAFASWQCTANPARAALAVEWVRPWMPYFMPGIDNADFYAVVDVDDLQLAEEVRAPGASTTPTGQPAEWHSIFAESIAAAYHVTGWHYYWAVVNHQAQFWSRIARTESAFKTAAWDASSIDGSVRWNMRNLRWWTVAQRLDATYRFAQASQSRPLRQEPFATELPWLIDGLEDFAWDSSRGAYRTGQVGTSLNSAWSYGVTGAVQNFTLSIINDWLIDYYQTVRADSRIPGMVRTNLDVVLSNTFLLEAGHPGYEAAFPKYGFWYSQTDTPLQPVFVSRGEVTAVGAWGVPATNRFWVTFAAGVPVRLQTVNRTFYTTTTTAWPHEPIQWAALSLRYMTVRSYDAANNRIEVSVHGAGGGAGIASEPFRNALATAVGIGPVYALEGDWADSPELPFTLPMFARSAAFVAAHVPDGTFGGVSYATWTARCQHPNQIREIPQQLKIVGEVFGNAYAAPAYRVRGAVAGPATIREPIVYTESAA